MAKKNKGESMDLETLTEEELEIIDQAQKAKEAKQAARAEAKAKVKEFIMTEGVDPELVDAIKILISFGGRSRSGSGSARVSVNDLLRKDLIENGSITER